jgi:hypothetical protein
MMKQGYFQTLQTLQETPLLTVFPFKGVNRHQGL